MEDDKEPGRPLEPAPETLTARERTLSHLDNLMRAAAAMAGTGVLLASGVQDKPRRPPYDSPPPPGSECCDVLSDFLFSCVLAHAAWTKTEGQWTLRLGLYVRVPSPVSFDGLSKSDIKLSGATLKELKAVSRQLDLLLEPAEDEKSPKLQFPVTCRQKKVPLKLSLDLSQPRAENRPIPVKLIK